MSAPQLIVMGGGPAGLAAAYYATRQGMRVTLLEATSRVGGNSQTFCHDQFRFDSGAHRFHDKRPAITADVLSMFNGNIHKVTSPSRIFHSGCFVDFPLSPLNMIKNLGPRSMLKAGTSLLVQKLPTAKPRNSLEDFAVSAYGRELASRFLLNYSEKLWGLPAAQLSPGVSGKRMKGLTLTTLLWEAVMGRRAATKHLDGSFYYPEYGIGEISKKLAASIGIDNIRTDSRVTRIKVNNGQVNAVEVNHGADTFTADFFISTLPIDEAVLCFGDRMSQKVITACDQLKYRDLLLVVLFLKKPHVSKCATIYFPDRDFPFTRIHEPKQRGTAMSPPDKTSLVVEIPFDSSAGLPSNTDRDKLVSLVNLKLADAGLINLDEIEDIATLEMPHAYPVLDLHFSEKLATAESFLKRFPNFQSIGRNGHFAYAHIHDMLAMGKEAASAVNRKITHE